MFAFVTDGSLILNYDEEGERVAVSEWEWYLHSMRKLETYNIYILCATLGCECYIVHLLYLMSLRFKVRCQGAVGLLFGFKCLLTLRNAM